MKKYSTMARLEVEENIEDLQLDKNLKEVSKRVLRMVSKLKSWRSQGITSYEKDLDLFDLWVKAVDKRIVEIQGGEKR